MKRLTLSLSEEMYLELVDAAASTYLRDESPVTPEEFAREAIETVLATRRCERNLLYA